MKKFSFLKGFGYIIIIMSIVVISYGAYNIYSASREVKDTLKTWNDKKITIVSGELTTQNTVNDMVKELSDKITRDSKLNRYENLSDQQSWDEDIMDIEKAERPHQIKIIQYDQTEYGEIIGEIKLNDESLPIITGIQDDLLKKGVLHYGETILPGLEGNSILLGHRDSVFKKLGQLKMNQTFEIQTLHNSLSFEIFDIKILKSDDMTVFDDYGFPTVSLVTCYPFNFLASRTERYVVVGKLIAYR